MSRYLVTNSQFQAFVDATDGYGSPDWWEGMPDHANDGPKVPKWSELNCPRETISWYEAVAFCRWLSKRLNFEVRLPTEHEWQQAATGGDASRVYPWGREWDAQCCNTEESGPNRTTSVGLYPAGANAWGVCDLVGNVWELTGDDLEDPNDLGRSRIYWYENQKVQRGGSFKTACSKMGVRAQSNIWVGKGDNETGFRLVRAAPS
jgi:formylglycine-generating enzyme required for sulfatase activity